MGRKQLNRLARVLASRAGATLAALVTYLLLTLPQLALAKAPSIDPDGNGTDLWSNIAPADLGGRADQYPVSAWRLDYHVDAVKGGVGLGGIDLDLSGVPALALHALAGVIWQFYVELCKGVLTLFSWAFGTNLLDPKYGVLAPIAQVTTDLHDALGPWTTVAVLGLGGALTWRLFLRRDVGGTVGQLFSTIVAVTVALLLVNNPAWTADFASGISRETAAGLLSATNSRTSGASTDPRIRATDSLWNTLVADPWTVLQFGGTEHCVDNDDKPVSPSSSDCKTRIDHRKKYVDAFLAAGNANGGTRTALYEAIATGKTPSDDRINKDLKADEGKVQALKVGNADKPAADLMGQSGAEDRLAAVPVILIGGLGALLMVGAMAATQLVMQVYFLLLLTLAAVMFLAALIPGRPQAAFRGWIERLIGALVRQVVIALLLGVAVAIASALTNAGGSLGWLFVFIAQAVFWWSLFFYRRELVAVIGMAAPQQAGAHAHDDHFVRGVATSYFTAKDAFRWQAQRDQQAARRQQQARSFQRMGPADGAAAIQATDAFGSSGGPLIPPVGPRAGGPESTAEAPSGPSDSVNGSTTGPASGGSVELPTSRTDRTPEVPRGSRPTDRVDGSPVVNGSAPAERQPTPDGGSAAADSNGGGGGAPTQSNPSGARTLDDDSIERERVRPLRKPTSGQAPGGPPSTPNSTTPPNPPRPGTPPASQPPDLSAPPDARQMPPPPANLDGQHREDRPGPAGGGATSNGSSAVPPRRADPTGRPPGHNDGSPSNGKSERPMPERRAPEVPRLPSEGPPPGPPPPSNDKEQ